MRKIIIEGHSEDSMDAALSDAMARAAVYISEGHDAHISILEMTMMPGRGFKAVLEVTIIPVTDTRTLRREGSDLELKRIVDRAYRARRKYDEGHLKQMIADHFAMTLRSSCPDIPDAYLAIASDAELLNNLIEKEFLHAAHPPVDVPRRDKGEPSLKQVLGKPLEPEPE